MNKSYRTCCSRIFQRGEMQKLQPAIILTCLAFINFPRGCFATTKCSMAERWKCYNEYTQVKLHRFHNDAYICSAAREYDICLNNILDDCKANPHVADVGLVISQAKHIQKEMKDIRKAHKCGACEKKHSLVAITLGLLYYFLTLKS